MRLAGNRWRHAALPTGPGRSDDEPRTDDESRTDDEARPQTPALSGAVLSNAVKHNPKLIGYASSGCTSSRCVSPPVEKFGCTRDNPASEASKLHCTPLLPISCSVLLKSSDGA